MNGLGSAPGKERPDARWLFAALAVALAPLLAACGPDREGAAQRATKACGAQGARDIEYHHEEFDAYYRVVCKDGTVKVVNAR